MTEKKRTSRRLQQAARERMKQTGENYTAALYAVRNADPSNATAVPPESISGRERASRTGKGASTTGEKRSSGEGSLFGDDAAQLGRDIVDKSVAQDLAAVRERLRELWPDLVIDVWLTSTNSHLDGARPIDVLALDGVESVMGAIDVEVAGGSR